MITNRLRRNAALTETVNNKVIKVTTSNERGNTLGYNAITSETTANRMHERVVATNGEC